MFGIRIVNVSIGTLRTITVVQGRLKLSVVLGFFEVLIWITALSQVLVGASTNPVLILAYAGGFAGGNAVEPVQQWAEGLPVPLPQPTGC